MKDSSTQVTLNWTGTGNFAWSFYEEDSNGNWVLLLSGTTTLTTEVVTGLFSGRLYKFEIRRICSSVQSEPAMIYFSTSIPIPIPPIDPCVSTGTYSTIVDTSAAWNTTINIGNFSLLCWRIRTNNGPWSAVDNFGSNPNLILNTPTFNACVEVEIGVQWGNNFYFPTDAGFPGWVWPNCATQFMTTWCVNRLTPPPLSTSPYMTALFTNPFFQQYLYMVLMVPDLTTFYNNTDRYGNVVGAYWRFKATGNAWIGGSTTVADPVLGTVGPINYPRLYVYEPF
jgi:hypothetical protein